MPGTVVTPSGADLSINVQQPVPTADSTANATLADVAGQKTDAVLTAVGTTKSLMAYVKTILQNVGFLADAAVTTVGTSSSIMAYVKGLFTAAGTTFITQGTVTSSAIPNNTQTNGAITGAASGAIVIEDIIVETDATGLAGAGITNFNFTVDNVSGLTGASAPIVAQAKTGLTANKTVSCKAEATTKHLPFTLETGKKLYISGDAGAGTGAGVARVTLICRRVAGGNSLASVNL